MRQPKRNDWILQCEHGGNDDDQLHRHRRWPGVHFDLCGACAEALEEQRPSDIKLLWPFRIEEWSDISCILVQEVDYTDSSGVTLPNDYPQAVS